jgi:acyl dehydratase
MEGSAMAKWNNMTNLTFDEIQAGTSASLTRTLSQTDVEVLALVSGDVDPFHVAGDGAVRSDARTTEAAGAEALIAGALGTRLPGPGMKILRENLQYRGTISVGDTLTATVTAREKQAEGSEVAFACRCVNQAGEELASGTVTVLERCQSVAGIQDHSGGRLPRQDRPAARRRVGPFCSENRSINNRATAVASASARPSSRGPPTGMRRADASRAVPCNPAQIAVATRFALPSPQVAGSRVPTTSWSS